MRIDFRLVLFILLICESFIFKAPTTNHFSTNENTSQTDTQNTGKPTTQGPLESAAIKTILDVVKNFDPQNKSSLNDLRETITSKEIEDLKAQIENEDTNARDRQTALYILTQIENTTTTEALAEIANSPIPAFDNLNSPHSRETYLYHAELALRVTALETLDQRSANSSDAQKYIEAIAKNQANPTLKFLARISLEGILSQRPGKLHRVTETILAEKE